MMNNKYFTVCGIVEINGKILLVRHTYGTAEGRILVPGGYVEEGELPSKAIEREVFEETGVSAKTKAVFSVQFKPEQWCIVFTMDHVSGEPKSDGYENNEVLLISAEEAAERDDITNMSREILRAYIADKANVLGKSSYVPRSTTADKYEIYGV
ncbi:NUDIX domain-containing protein [uncultured Ruminococcus sp.]|uniref:NUDIX domain-containing protein n=1 Tax=uncultured Ruminococcus sp. TaxID=165186 RepID=UPI0025DABF9C|nr:NUDIX domain-containing protein [uncultured Ruminococcus sp.]